MLTQAMPKAPRPGTRALTIARKEFKEMARDGRYAWAAGAIFALLVASLLMGWRNYAETNRQIAAARDEQRELWLNLPARNPHSAAHRGIYVFKPVMPLSAVDAGVDPYTGVSILLEAHDQNLSQHKPVEDATAIARFGETTAAATLQILAPLLIVLLVFPSFAGERETGTLRQLLSLGVPRRTLALGKGLGAVAPLLLLLIPATLIGVVAMWLNTAPAAFALTLPRVGVMTLSYSLYFITFIGLSLIVSAKASSSRLALVVLLAFWFVNSLVAPRVMADVAQHAVKTPSTAEFLQQIDEDKKRIPPNWKQKLIADLLAKYRVTRKEDLPISLSGVLLIEQDKLDDALYERNFSRLFDLYERQNTVYTAGSIFAPLLSMQTLSMGLAGTDFNQHRHFTEAVSEYRQEWLRVLNEDILFHQRPGQMVYTRGRDLWEQVPPFAYRPPSLHWVVSQQRLSLALLVAWFLAVVSIMPLALTRIKIE